MSGMLYIILGTMVLMQSNFDKDPGSTYNPFGDAMIVVVLLVNWLLLWLVFKLTMWCRVKLKIWIVEPEAKLVRTKSKTFCQEPSILKTSSPVSRNVPYLNYADVEKSEHFAYQRSIDPEINFGKKFEMIHVLRRNQQGTQKNLEKIQLSKFNDSDYKDKFMSENQKWMKDNIGSVLSP